MSAVIKEENGLKRKLEFVVSAVEVKECFSKNYQKIQKKAKMPGFRQGKIPLETIKKTYKDDVYKDVMDDLFRTFYPKALNEIKIKPAGPPTLIDLKLEEGKECQFLLEVEVHPQVKVTNYMNLELKKKAIKVTEEQINQTLEKIRNSSATFEDSLKESELKDSDFAVFDLYAFDSKNKKLMDYKNLLLEIGKDRIAKGFDKKLIGLKKGEEKQFDFTFPKEQTNSQIAGLTLNIKVKLISFKDKKIPELNDELAKRFKVENLKELKEKIKIDLKANLKQTQKDKLENDLIKQLIDKNPVDLPEALIEDQKQRLKQNALKRLEEYKMPKAEQEIYLKKHDKEFNKEAKSSLHISYIMDQLIKDLDIKLFQDDINNSIKESFPKKDPKEMENQLKKERYWDNFLFNLTRKKLISKLIAESKITEE
ncbi:MAG: trigger factor [Bdellovibrionaceae bacterium]|nr:trigger factor [Pseudobdellovibrionaceae bacterium]